ncbi:MAG TPA: hypothetical protein VF092_27860 [Longimicrobium sp.]
METPSRSPRRLSILKPESVGAHAGRGAEIVVIALLYLLCLGGMGAGALTVIFADDPYGARSQTTFGMIVGGVSLLGMIVLTLVIAIDSADALGLSRRRRRRPRIESPAPHADGDAAPRS